MLHRLIVNGELVLYGTVGGGFFFEDGFTAGDVVAALGEMSGDISVRLNSGGGIAWDGIAIYNAFKAHQGRVKIKVDAIAASAASIILMAGDERIVPPSATVMIHNASGITFGTAKDHSKTVEILEKLDGQMAQLYASASDTKVSEVKKMMDAETWLTGDEAVDEGFADAAPEDATKAAASMFDYRVYANAPEHLKLVAANFTNAPERSGRKPRGLAAQDRSQQEQSMTEAEKTAAAEKAAADKLAADKAAAEKAVADKAAADKAAADNKPAAADTIASAVTAERQRNADITAACSLAGQSDKAAAFIAEGKSLSEVVTALQTARAKPASEISARHADTTQTAGLLDKHVDKINARMPNGRAA